MAGEHARLFTGCLILDAFPASGPGRKSEATPAAPLPVRMRRCEIGAADLDSIVDLLTQGFPARGRDHGVNAIDRLSDISTPAGYPKYGFLLERKGLPVGVSLHIYSRAGGWRG